MVKKSTSIPVNIMTDEFGGDISIERITVDDLRMLGKTDAINYEEAKESHRHDRHSFFLLESGTVSIEIDFEKCIIESPSIIYMHPNQVHRTIAFKNVIVSSWAIKNENLNPEYLPLLEDITPAKPLLLDAATFSIISEAVSLSIKLSERKNDKLYRSLLKNSCNTLIALVVSQYLKQAKPVEKLSRFELVTKAFKEILERDYTTAKRPTAYAKQLNISTPYLNECVKNTTGYSVSHLIHDRIMLEAKRLLFYSNKSVKEISSELGYDDYPYFSRLFTKAAGISALAFRNKNHD